MNDSKCTQGEATAGVCTIDGKRMIAVGIVGTKKAIAVCGLAGAADEEESMANAERIALDWNARRQSASTTPGA